MARRGEELNAWCPGEVRDDLLLLEIVCQEGARYTVGYKAEVANQGIYQIAVCVIAIILAAIIPCLATEPDNGTRSVIPHLFQVSVSFPQSPRSQHWVPEPS